MYPFEDDDGLGRLMTGISGQFHRFILMVIHVHMIWAEVLEGGSIINRMCWTRGGKADFDALVALGNPGWGWDDLLPYFIKTENYTDDVEADFSRELYIQPNLSTMVQTAMFTSATLDISTTNLVSEFCKHEVALLTSS
jgi:choline dehydrogenase-like flavoprotein